MNEKKLVKKQLEYTGSDEDMIVYLELLWSSSEEFKTNNKTFEKLNILLDKNFAKK